MDTFLSAVTLITHTPAGTVTDNRSVPSEMALAMSDPDKLKASTDVMPSDEAYAVTSLPDTSTNTSDFSSTYCTPEMEDERNTKRPAEEPTPAGRVTE